MFVLKVSVYIHCAVLEVPTPLSVVYRSDGPLENGIIVYQHVVNSLSPTVFRKNS